ncbi:hypothetical protein NBT05_08580 [Aquimarina sp. ERC-38]|uniref:cell division protein FtsQ/DivIB n=1 Tax=Aquimarina sp. ERC-38 TaxID=2949996 RepID=UPI002246A19C|nr:hypothetical protein [Aquimarina sp. ERC-38]UZO82518.1 hypothetical protein NBT05_08580 [Aquimarina sp. ERC-38]
MKRMMQFLKMMVLIVVLGGMYAFADQRNKNRRVKDLQIKFVDQQDPYLNELSVDKLLIQNQIGVANIGKEILALNNAEAALDAHQLIEESDVYVSVNGQLNAIIKQKTPIARVDASTPYYIDITGKRMPLSQSYTAHVPMVYQVSEMEVPEVYKLVKQIWQDEFLKKHITDISRISAHTYELGIRALDFKVVVGTAENLEEKFKNFKAFYQKAVKDKSLEKYSKVNLAFKNQVVCTLK